MTDFLNVNPNWLFRGEGEPRKELSRIKSTGKVHPLGDSSPIVIKHYEAFLRSVPYQMAMLDTEARYIMATDSYIDAYQIRDHVPLQGKRIRDVFTNEDSLKYERELLSGNPSTRLKTRYYEPNGIGMYIAWRTRPWYVDGSGLVGGYVVITSTGPDEDHVKAVADIAYDENGMPWAALAVGNDTIDVVKYTEARRGELPTTDESEDSISLHRIQLIESIDAIINSQIPEGELDMILKAEGGTLRLHVTEMFRRLDGRLRKIEIFADIYNAEKPNSDDPLESSKKEPPTAADWIADD